MAGRAGRAGTVGTELQGDSVRAALRVAPGAVLDLRSVDARSTPGFDLGNGGRRSVSRAKETAGGTAAEESERLAVLQERLFAEATEGGKRSVLLVLQGTDTSGKDGAITHVVGGLNPQGLSVTAFTKPTAEELRHDFLWRIRRGVPAAGQVGVFNRSHYEDVLVVRVHGIVPPEEVERRYDAINDFEQRLTTSGTTLVKVALHLSYDEQRERLLARLDDPDKHWKFNPGDLAERARWEDYRQAYEIALGRCSTDAAPWYLVPADRKWYRNWAVRRLLLETLEELAPQYPAPDLDIDALRTALIPPH